MSWLCRLGWWLRPRPAPAIYFIEKWVHLVVVVEQRPWWPVFRWGAKSKGDRPPKRLKRNRHKRRSRNRHSRYNPPY